MIDLRERTLQQPQVEKRSPALTAPAPPKQMPPIGRSVTTPWPRNAKVVTAVLVVVALLGAFGTIIGFASGDDGPAIERRYQSQIDQLTDERDIALGTNDDLQSQLATVNDRATTVAQQRDALTAELTAVESRIETLTGRTSELQAQLDTTTASNGVLQGQLASQVGQTQAVTAERDALAKLFPLTFDASLVGVDLVGTYDIKWNEAFCSGLATCGKAPAVNEVTITTTPEGWLTMRMNGFVTAGLHRVDGALFTIVDSTTALPAVGTTPRLARVAITLYAHGVTVADDGTRQIDDLGASIAISAPAAAGAPDAVVFYGAELTRQS